MNRIERGIDVILYVNGMAVGGQEGATLVRSATPIDITNRINPEWQENIVGMKQWNINCNGSYIKDSKSLTALENAFMTNTPIEVKIIFNNKTYIGEAYIINLPLSAVFKTHFKYSISLLGTGELSIEDIGD